MAVDMGMRKSLFEETVGWWRSLDLGTCLCIRPTAIFSVEQ